LEGALRSRVILQSILVYPWFLLDLLLHLGSGDPTTLSGEKGEGDVFIVLSTTLVRSMPSSATTS
jgi:hypothetical protein